MTEAKEPFISQRDRPDVKIDPDKPVSELTVRDLRIILGDVAIFKSHADGAVGKNQLGNEKQGSIKDERVESDLRIIFGDVAVLKSHVDVGIFKDQLGNEKQGFSNKERFETSSGDAGGGVGNGFTRLIEHFGGLHNKIDELANQIAELKKQK